MERVPRIFWLAGLAVGLCIVPISAQSAAAAVSPGQVVVVAVTYEGIANPVQYSFNECIPIERDGHLATKLAFEQDAAIFGYPNPDCTGGTFPPVPIPVFKGLVIENTADALSVFGEAFDATSGPIP